MLIETSSIKAVCWFLFSIQREFNNWVVVGVASEPWDMLTLKHLSQWRHDGLDNVSNHQPHDCFLKRLFRRRSKINIKAPRHWPLCGEFTGTGDFPAHSASYAENVSIWWGHHVNLCTWTARLMMNYILEAITDNKCQLTHIGNHPRPLPPTPPPPPPHLSMSRNNRTCRYIFISAQTTSACKMATLTLNSGTCARYSTELFQPDYV